MAFSFLSQELAIDLGTANTIIYQNGSIVLDEPSIVALDVTSGKCIAIGSQAKLMHGRNNPNIKTVRPLKDGVIADFNAGCRPLGSCAGRVVVRRGPRQLGAGHSRFRRGHAVRVAVSPHG